MSTKTQGDFPEKRCGLCNRTAHESYLRSGRPLAQTDCCKNWIFNDQNLYVFASYARNSCKRNHERYTICGVHHSQGHKGKWKDCHACKDDMDYVHYAEKATNEYNFEKINVKREAFVCFSCGFES